MLCDHIGYIFVGNFSFLNLIGRFAFPVFAFQSTEGYIHTKNFRKYMIRLIIFACISQIPFMLFLSIFSNTIYLNVLFTFVLGLFAIYLYDKSSNKFLGFIFVIIIELIAHFIKVDYGIYGIGLMFVFYVFKNKKHIMIPIAIFLTILQYGFYIIKYPSLIVIYLLYIIFTCLAFIFIAFYNKKEGKKVKYLFYIFYPTHLLILYLVSYFLL